MNQNELIDKLTKAAMESGKLIEVGWLGLRKMSIPEDAPEIQLTEMRNAFFAGAQHLFASIMATMDEGEEITEADLNRMTLVEKELREFYEDFKKKHGL